jgi:hypothetical protein
VKGHFSNAPSIQQVKPHDKAKRTRQNQDTHDKKDIGIISKLKERGFKEVKTCIGMG